MRPAAASILASVFGDSAPYFESRAGASPAERLGKRLVPRWRHWKAAAGLGEYHRRGAVGAIPTSGVDHRRGAASLQRLIDRMPEADIFS